MKILFFIPFSPDFDPLTPLTQPLGGTESAIAYLATELVRAGVEVTLLNPSSRERVVQGVRIMPPSACPPDVFRSHDIAVVVGGAFGARLRQQLGLTAPMLLWCHLMVDQPAMKQLAMPEERAVWDGFVTVSQWQAEQFQSYFELDAERMEVIGNAISPSFAEQEVEPAWFETGAAPCLLYSSTPYRGLDRLLMAYPTIRAAVPDVTLKIFSGMRLYGEKPETDVFRYLYALTQALPGGEYIGPVSQQELAKAYRGAAALAYPTTFEETSCITVMEAMASGADILTSAYGALPETLAGHGRMTPPTDVSKALVRTPADILPYAEMVIDALKQARANPAQAADERAKRVAFARNNYSWAKRAQQWIALAERLVAQRRSA